MIFKDFLRDKYVIYVLELTDLALSLFKPFRGKDYKFIDKMVRQQFQIGGTTILIHPYLGPQDSQPTGDITQPGGTGGVTTIQDVLFLENRDRKYSPDLIELKGHYTLNDLEFNLSQFGLMLAGDNLFISFHLNEMVERLGRKIIAGDVFEIVHRRDDLLLDETLPAINAFYVVTDAARSAEGYSSTWYSHIWRTKAQPVKDSQEFKDILDSLAGADAQLNEQLKNALSTSSIIQSMNDAVVAQANAEVSKRNSDSSHLYIRTDGKPLPTDQLIPWILGGDTLIPNTNDVAPSGRHFPQSPTDGDYFIRTDYVPARMFQRQNGRWQAIKEDWRVQWENAHKTLADYLMDTNVTTVGPRPEDTFNELQPLTDVVPNKSEIIPPDELV